MAGFPFFLVCRYMSQSKHAEARELMYSGALLFFSHGQVSGAMMGRGLGRVRYQAVVGSGHQWHRVLVSMAVAVEPCGWSSRFGSVFASCQ